MTQRFCAKKILMELNIRNGDHKDVVLICRNTVFQGEQNKNRHKKKDEKN